MSKETTLIRPITLIRPKEVLRLLPFVSRSGLYAGSRGTGALTKYPVGGQTLYSLEEVEELLEKIIGKGKAIKEHSELKRRKVPGRIPTKLI